nr:hypothetical protein [uncultured Dongia sp.]
MRKQGSNLRVTRAIATVLMACLLAAVAQPGFADEPPKQSLTPLPSLNTVEECQRADLSRNYGKTFRFHHGECWADVSINENGNVTSFIPEDEDACRKALKVGCGWVD